MNTKKFIWLLLTLLIVMALPMQAMAKPYNIADGSVTISNDTTDSSTQTVTQNGVSETDSNPTIYGTSNQNTLTLAGGGYGCCNS